MGPNDTLLDLLLEAQALDRVDRAGYALRGVPDPESVAEHSYQVALAVWALAPLASGPLDGARAVEIALLHDLAEVRAGDLPPQRRPLPPGRRQAHRGAGGLRRARRSGRRARHLPLRGVPRRGAGRRRDSVRACDKLQLMVKVLVYEGWGCAGLAEFWNHAGNFPDTNEFPLFGEDCVTELRPGAPRSTAPDDYRSRCGNSKPPRSSGSTGGSVHASSTIGPAGSPRSPTTGPGTTVPPAGAAEPARPAAARRHAGRAHARAAGAAGRRAAARRMRDVVEHFAQLLFAAPVAPRVRLELAAERLGEHGRRQHQVLEEADRAEDRLGKEVDRRDEDRGAHRR